MHINKAIHTLLVIWAMVDLKLNSSEPNRHSPNEIANWIQKRIGYELDADTVDDLRDELERFGTVKRPYGQGQGHRIIYTIYTNQIPISVWQAKMHKATTNRYKKQLTTLGMARRNGRRYVFDATVFLEPDAVSDEEAAALCQLANELAVKLESKVHVDSVKWFYDVLDGKELDLELDGEFLRQLHISLCLPEVV